MSSFSRKVSSDRDLKTNSIGTYMNRDNCTPLGIYVFVLMGINIQPAEAADSVHFWIYLLSVSGEKLTAIARGKIEVIEDDKYGKGAIKCCMPLLITLIAGFFFKKVHNKCQRKHGFGSMNDHSRSNTHSKSIGLFFIEWSFDYHRLFP